MLRWIGKLRNSETPKLNTLKHGAQKQNTDQRESERNFTERNSDSRFKEVTADGGREHDSTLFSPPSVLIKLRARESEV